jgi:hypothetical protein
MSARVRASKQLSYTEMLAMEIVSWTLSYVPAAIAWSVGIWSLACASGFPGTFQLNCWLLLAIAVLPLTLTFALSVAQFVLRMLLPRLREGVHAVGMNARTISWYGHLALNRAIHVAGLWPLVNSSQILKLLYFRSMGAQVEIPFNSSLHTTYVDMPLIRIGRGSTISEGVALSCHTFVGDKLVLKATNVGRGVFIGMHSFVGVGAELGDGAWIGMRNFIANAKVEGATKLDDYAWEKGRPKAPAEPSA